jgi:hypothetical protein
MGGPCCDVFELEDGKIKRFDCYPEGSIIFAQLGVLNNLDAALVTENRGTPAALRTKEGHVEGYAHSGHRACPF